MYKNTSSNCCTFLCIALQMHCWCLNFLSYGDGTVYLLIFSVLLTNIVYIIKLWTVLLSTSRSYWIKASHTRPTFHRQVAATELKLHTHDRLFINKPSNLTFLLTAISNKKLDYCWLLKPGTHWRQSRMLKRLSTKINTFVKLERTGDNVADSVDFVAGSFDFLHNHEHVLI